MSNPAGSFIWYELMTPDHGAAKRFYDPIMGWSIEAEAAGDVNYLMITLPDANVGGVLPLTPEMTAGGARPGWFPYICVDDVDATVARAEALGGQVMMPAHDMPGVGRFALLADPNGAPFYVMRPTPRDDGAVSTVFAPEQLGHVAWNELYARDQRRALDFYGTLFGWTRGDAMPMGPAGDYVFFHHGDLRLGGVMPRTDIPSAWAFYFAVPDIHAAKSAIEAGGGTVIMGPVPVPGGLHSVLAFDPQGAVFGVVGPAS